jgi:hypothetical protein
MSRPHRSATAIGSSSRGSTTTRGKTMMAAATTGSVSTTTRWVSLPHVHGIPLPNVELSIPSDLAALLQRIKREQFGRLCTERIVWGRFHRSVFELSHHLSVHWCQERASAFTSETLSMLVQLIIWMHKHGNDEVAMKECFQGIVRLQTARKDLFSAKEMVRCVDFFSIQPEGQNNLLKKEVIESVIEWFIYMIKSLPCEKESMEVLQALIQHASGIRYSIIYRHILFIFYKIAPEHPTWVEPFEQEITPFLSVPDTDLKTPAKWIIHYLEEYRKHKSSSTGSSGSYSKS